jgi:hypothetical protein
VPDFGDGPYIGALLLLAVVEAESELPSAVIEQRMVHRRRRLRYDFQAQR